MAYQILMTWRNMESGPLQHFVTRAVSKEKHGGMLSFVFFDSTNAASDLRTQLLPVKSHEPIKIFISGHGGIGKDFITDDKREQRKTIVEIANILIPALK